jgi:acetyltransferase-like isoleucine patch superfamily enzyme
LVVIYAGCRIDSKVMVADLASVREDVSIGEMTIIGRGVTVENKVSIGRRCKIESEAYITALSDIGDYCFVSPEVTFTNDNFLGRTKERFKYHKGVTMKRGARVGANATVMPGLTIEEDGLVGAGAVVTRDVPARKLVVGVPARVIKDVPQEQLVENQEW